MEGMKSVLQEEQEDTMPGQEALRHVLVVSLPVDLHELAKRARTDQGLERTEESLAFVFAELGLLLPVVDLGKPLSRDLDEPQDLRISSPQHVGALERPLHPLSCHSR